jgi:hypothetical protein
LSVHNGAPSSNQDALHRITSDSKESRSRRTDTKSAAEWKELISKLADAGAQARREAREKLGVTMEPTVIGGVRGFHFDPQGNPTGKS